MKFNRELLLPLMLALLTTLGLHYFWNWRQTAQQQVATSGQKFEAPTTTFVPLHKPLQLEVDFVDTKPIRPTKLTTVETKDTRYVFSNDGACLQQVSFFRNWGGTEGYLNTLPSEQHAADQHLCTFLVALQDKTPFYFNLVEERHDNQEHVLVYQADFKAGTISKKFVMYDTIHRVDVEITVEPKAGQELQPRIFYTSPYLHENVFLYQVNSEGARSFEDTLLAINNDEKDAIQQQAITAVAGNYWLQPHIFGAMDKYFVFSLVGDEQKFAQRGYYKPVGKHQLFSIIEGPKINQKTTWKLAFYIGPKSSKEMTAVNEQLDGVMRYGIMAPISRPIARIMLDILNFLYRFCGNYGLAIILITLLLKLLLLPFTLHGEQAMNKTRQQRSQFENKLKYLQEKYKDDPQALAQARAELIKKHGIPGLGGCLPLLLQLPMFWGLSIVLSNSIELYKASFLWIPDLSLPDPYYILPILVGFSILFHNPTGDTQQRLTQIVLGIFLAAITINFSAGLALYIFVNTASSIVQTLLVQKWKKV